MMHVALIYRKRYTYNLSSMQIALFIVLHIIVSSLYLYTHAWCYIYSYVALCILNIDSMHACIALLDGPFACTYAV